MAGRSYATFLIAVGLAAAGCAQNTPPSAAPGSSSATSVASTIPPPGSVVTLPAADPAAVKRRLEEATPQARVIVDQVRGLLGLQEPEAACVAGRLDADPNLRVGLGDQPAISARYQELTNLAADCIRRTSGAVAFANSIQTQAGGALTGEQLGCLRDRFAALTGEDVSGIVRNGLNPGSTNPIAQGRLSELLDSCRVNVTKLTPP